MVKLKQAEERSSNQNISINSSDDGVDWNLLGEDWVIVNKQKVNILIPPLPGSSDPIASNPTSEQLQDAVLRELDNTTVDHPADKGSLEQLALVKDKPSSATTENIPISAKSCNPPNGVVTPLNCRSPRILYDSQQTFCQLRDDVLKGPKSRARHGLGTVKHWKLSPWESKIKDGPVLLSKMMKASNLERKLLRAGGLSRWLTSVGLEQFIRIFHARKVSKFQLVNLSMSKLKDMGIHAVGPRRKLMHAIECVCHPYCFEAL